MSLGETFSNWIVFARISKYGKGAIVHIPAPIRTIYYVTCQSSSETDILDIYLTPFFGVQKFKKYMSYEDHPFFESVQNGI